MIKGELFENLKIYALENRVPIIRDQSALFLQEQIKLKNPQTILEIGTAIGYSACLMLDSCNNAKLMTIELKEKSYKKALETFSLAGVENQVEAINGDAMDVVKSLAKEERKFDFIFLDGPKGQYVRYLPYCKKMLTKGGIIFADNVYLHGLVSSKEPIKHKHRAMVNNMRKFLFEIQNDNDFETTIFDIEDGIAIIRKK